MVWQRIDEDPWKAESALRHFAGFSLLPALAIRVLTTSPGLVESMCILVCGQLVLMYTHYHLRPQSVRLRRRARIRVSLVIATACGILMSHSGLRVRSVSLIEAAMFGAVFGAVAHLLMILAGPVVNLVLNQMREFSNTDEYRACGYSTRGNLSGICPECGNAVPITGNAPEPD